MNAGLLREGTNVLAVEVHQAGATSSDLFFNLELKASPALVRPVLAVSQSLQQLHFEWPVWAGGLSLWATTNLQPPTVWMPVTNAIFVTNGGITVTVPIEQSDRFFQLRAQ